MTGTQERTPGRRAAIVAVTSGKGGVGKTSVVVNLAASLARMDRRVAILDGDFALGSVDVLLGLAPRWHLGHLLDGQKELDEIIVEGPSLIHVVPASSGLRELTSLSAVQWRRLEETLDALAASYDCLLIDTAAGISDNVIDLLGFSSRVLVVTSAEPSALVDAYALIKILASASPGGEIGVLVNDARDGAEGRLVFEQLDEAATRFLGRRLTAYGTIPHDEAVRDAILGQRTLAECCPRSPAARAFTALAARVAALGPSEPKLRLVPGRAACRPEMEIQPCA